jgi:Uma2 family endonuclease
MALLQRITEAEYRTLALEDGDHTWELWDGVPVAKPGMSVGHNDAAMLMGYWLLNQLDWDVYMVRVDAPRTRINPRNYFVPDVAVVPVASAAHLERHELEVYARPLPLVVEVWSPSTGGYDQGAKLRAYKERGDAEIWLLHPIDRTLRASRRQPDGSYVEAVYPGGVVEVASLPGVRIDLDALFDRRRPTG